MPKQVKEIAKIGYFVGAPLGALNNRETRFY